MTRRATFTQAELVRFGRAADKLGKVLIITRDGAVFADPDKVTLPPVETERPNSCDEIFGLDAPRKPKPW